MFTNYLKVTLRNLARNLLFVIINIIALGLALSIAIVAYLNHKYDSDWDKSHVMAEEIYKVNFTHEIQGRQQSYGATPIPVGNFIGENISGVEAVIRFHGTSSPLKLGLNNFSRNIGYADPGFMDLFTFPIVKGSAEAFKDRQNILIDETIASAYFGEEDPVGKIMSIFNDNGEEFTYTVGAVFEDLPLNTSFQFRVLTQFDNYLDMWNVDESRWRTWIAATFLHIPNAEQAETVEELLEGMVPAHKRFYAHAVMLMDSDKSSAYSHINDTKKRLKAEFNRGPGFAWVTKGREIENYLRPELLTKSPETVQAVTPAEENDWCRCQRRTLRIGSSALKSSQRIQTY